MKRAHLWLASAACLAAAPALAQTAASTAAIPAPETPAAPAAPATVTLPTPGMTAPLTLNPNPYALGVGPLGKWYVTGAVTGLGLVQDNASPGDQNARLDLSNGQIFIQKTEGFIQFYAQVGAYTLPALGTPYIPVSRAPGDYYSAVPQAFVKIAPSSDFSVELGKLPTLFGAESTFTFENQNIDRGLLWNQENAVNRGLQANYTIGPVAVSVAATDGYYSDRYNWIDGSVAWTINTANTLTFVGGGNIGRTGTSTIATPLLQNNSQMYNVIYAYSAAPWTITPYVQLDAVPKDVALGIGKGGSTYGAAVLATYAFTPNISLGGRLEYIGSSGNAADGAPDLLYGPGSKAYSFTLTPTYQYKRLFVRGDLAYVRATSVTPGAGLGANSNAAEQFRAVTEFGILF